MTLVNYIFIWDGTEGGTAAGHVGVVGWEGDRVCEKTISVPWSGAGAVFRASASEIWISDSPGTQVPICRLITLGLAR